MLTKLKYMLLILCPILCTSVYAQEAYSIDHDGAFLHKINLANATTLSTVVLTDLDGVIDHAIAIDTNPESGKLYIMYLPDEGEEKNNQDKGGGPQPISYLGIVNPQNGVISRLFTISAYFTDIAFLPEGSLYGVTGNIDLNPGQLFSISLIDGSRNLQATLSDDRNTKALTFDADTGQFYYADGDLQYSLDTLLFAQTPLSNTTSNEYVRGLHYDSQDGTIYQVDIDQNLFTMDSDGNLSLIGALDHDSEGIAIPYGTAIYQVPAVSPFSMVFLIISVILTLAFRNFLSA
ncbi:MAG: hypothetical protein ACWA5R_02420 [bacterium]